MRRLGSVVFAVGSDLERSDQDFIVAAESHDGHVYWKTRRDVAPNGFTIVRGHAIASAKQGGRWWLLEIELDTGKIVDRVRTKYGPYRLEVQPDGSLRGFALASEVMMAQGASWVIDVDVR